MNISVIVTTYNRPDALEKVLTGLQRQTRIPAEVLIADDGSGPDTEKMIRSVTAGFPAPLIHIRHEDKGFRAAGIRNRAVLRSTGDYIVLLDGDCIPESHFVEDHGNLAKEATFFQGKRILVGKRISGEFSPEHIRSPRKILRHLLSGEIGNGHHLIRVPFLPAKASTGLDGIRSCNMGFFREDIFAVNGFNEDFTGWGREDSELAVRFFKKGLKKRTHSFLAVCFHLWHPENRRDRLAENDELLRKAKNAHEYTCSKGLYRK